jgi:hypothetical protein
VFWKSLELENIRSKRFKQTQTQQRTTNSSPFKGEDWYGRVSWFCSAKSVADRFSCAWLLVGRLISKTLFKAEARTRRPFQALAFAGFLFISFARGPGTVLDSSGDVLAATVRDSPSPVWSWTERGFILGVSSGYDARGVSSLTLPS